MTTNEKKTNLFILLGSFFITNALIAEFIGVKIFSLENSLGITPFNIRLFSDSNYRLDLTCGVILWPFVFIMTDIINEYYGKKGVKRLSYIAAGMITYSFLMVFIAMHAAPAEWWPAAYTHKGVPDMQKAYSAIFGQGMWIIIGSLAAFLIGQLVDVYVFHALRKISNDKYLWLRSTGSTLVSQLIDSYVVLFIAFYIGQDWSLERVTEIGTVNYLYKFSVAIVLTPLLYVLHYFIDRYLGKATSEKMIEEADRQYEK